MADSLGSGLGILAFDSFHFVVEHLERSTKFYTDVLDFRPIAKAGDDLVARGGQQSIAFASGDARVCVSTPLAPSSKAARYLKRHPAGVMSLSFRVADLDQAAAYLDARGGTFLSEPFEVKDPSGGTYRSFEIATPLADLAFRFVEARDFPAFAPGFVPVGAAGDPAAPKHVSKFGIRSIDHVTSNGLTMQPIVAWYRDVLGFEPFWEIAFHTSEVKKELGTKRPGERDMGSGLRSIVMWDPRSGIKFATNEPLRPRFRDSQITKFVEDNGGAGVQHIAFAVDSILDAVPEMKRAGTEFMPTHPAYYRELPGRLAALGLSNVKEELSELEKHQVLVDGGEGRYMLQIFMREAAALYDEPSAGPFFYEIIQRAGDEGFGYGNFRALFESIERAQAPAGGAGGAGGTV